MDANTGASAKRRLFPLRRTPLTALNCLGMNGNQNGPLLDCDQSLEPAPDDVQDHLSDGESSTSSGTTKITGLSNLELPDFNTAWNHSASAAGDTNLSHPLNEDCGPAALEEVPSSQSPMKETQNGERGVVSTMPARHRDKAARRSVRWNSKTDVYDSDYLARIEPRRSLPDLRTAAYKFEKATGNTHGSPLRAVDQIPLNDTIFRIKTWDTSVKLCTVIVKSQRGTVQVNHHVQLSVAIPEQDISTTRISIRLDIANGIQRDRTCNLDRGQSSLFFGKDESLFSSEHHVAEINIIRHRLDAEKPLNIYFFSTLPTTNLNPIALLPTFRPSNGKVLSESICIAEPLPPLIVRALARDHYSTWKSTQSTSNRFLHFERLELPPLYPEGFTDDIRIKIIDPAPIRFWSSRDQGAAGVVWDLDIKVQRILGLQLECSMSLVLEIGAASILLSMDSHGWVPSFFLIDNCLATEAAGEWRQNDGYLTLFKQPQMVPGPLKIEMHWLEPMDEISLSEADVNQLVLPRIVDREVLSGSFICGTTGSASFSNLGVKDHLFFCNEGSAIRLPTLHKGYSLHLTRMSTRPQLPFSSVTEAISTSEDPETDKNAILQPSLGEDSGRVVSHSRKANKTSHPPLRALFLQMSIACTVISCLYFGAAYTRRRSDYGETSNHGASSLSTPIGINIPTLAETEPVLDKPIPTGAIGAEYDYSEEDRAGWRDWMDTTLGWKGYTP